MRTILNIPENLFLMMVLDKIGNTLAFTGVLNLNNIGKYKLGWLVFILVHAHCTYFMFLVVSGLDLIVLERVLGISNTITLQDRLILSNASESTWSRKLFMSPIWSGISERFGLTRYLGESKIFTSFCLCHPYSCSYQCHHGLPTESLTYLEWR